MTETTTEKSRRLGRAITLRALADAARARGDGAQAVALSAEAGAAMVVNPGPGRPAAPAAPAGGMVRVAAAAPSGAAAVAGAFEANMAAARDLIAKAEATVALDAEVAVRGRYAEAVTLLKSHDPAEKAQGSRMMAEPEVDAFRDAETSGRPYRPTVKAAAPGLDEGRMVALAKAGDMKGLEGFWQANPGSYETYRRLRLEGSLVPTAAERLELRKETDAQLKSRIKALHASKKKEDHDKLYELLQSDERAANLWREMCLQGEILLPGMNAPKAA